MKLIRFGESGKEKPGVLIGDKRLDVSSFITDYNEYFFENDGLKKLKNEISGIGHFPVADQYLRLGPPVARPSKIVCIGLNYADHAAESNMVLPAEPVVFLKSTTALMGPEDDLILPPGSEKTDWEVELAVVIGKKASYISEEEAMEHVAGYCLHNDYSERAYQMERGGQWVKGKSCDTFAPLGPWLVTTDEIQNVQNLRLWLTVNGKKYQEGNTKNFIFNIPYIISYVSRFMTLLPGDVISTGTPAGVGFGQKPHPIYLKPGDLVELGIDGLGNARQLAKAHR